MLVSLVKGTQEEVSGWWPGGQAECGLTPVFPGKRAKKEKMPGQAAE